MSPNIEHEIRIQQIKLSIYTKRTNVVAGFRKCLQKQCVNSDISNDEDDRSDDARAAKAKAKQTETSSIKPMVKRFKEKFQKSSFQLVFWSQFTINIIALTSERSEIFIAIVFVIVVFICWYLYCSKDKFLNIHSNYNYNIFNGIRVSFDPFDSIMVRIGQLLMIYNELV